MPIATLVATSNKILWLLSSFVAMATVATKLIFRSSGFMLYFSGSTIDKLHGYHMWYFPCN